MNGWFPPRAREGAVLLRLVLVVELVGEPLADLSCHRLGVHARRDPLRDAHDQPEILEVGAHGVRDAWVLDLDGHVAPVVEARDRPGRSTPPPRRSRRTRRRRRRASRRDPTRRPCASCRRTRAAPRRAAPPASPGCGPGTRVGTRLYDGERRDLADLHGRALHLPEHVEDLLGRLDLTALRRLAPALPRRGSGWRPWWRTPRRLRAGQLSDLRRSAHPAGRKVLGIAPGYA